MAQSPMITKEMLEQVRAAMADRNSFLRNLKDPTARLPNGKHRRTSPPAHRDPAQRADPVHTGVDPGSRDQTVIYTMHFAIADWAKLSLLATLAAVDPNPVAPETPYAGIRVGEIIGYRAWRVGREPTRNHRWTLASLVSDFVWHPKQVVEGDINKIVSYRSWDIVPIYGGVYAFNTPELNKDTHQRIVDPNFRWADEIFAIGTVSLWGDVVEHEHGYRASHARLRSIDAVYGPSGCPSVTDLQKEYGLDQDPR